MLNWPENNGKQFGKREAITAVTGKYGGQDQSEEAWNQQQHTYNDVNGPEQSFLFM